MGANHRHHRIGRWLAHFSCAVAFLCCFAPSPRAEPFKFFFDENNSLQYNLYDMKGVQQIAGKFVKCGAGANDAPCGSVTFLTANTPQQAWSYALPAGVTAADGVVLLTGKRAEANADAFIFKNNVIYVFSVVQADEFLNKKEGDGSALPNADNVQSMNFRNPNVTLNEDVRDDENSGVVYKPGKDDPGSSKKSTNVYAFASDGTGGLDVIKIKKDMASTDPAKSAGHSVSYNAAAQELSFADDVITDTTFAGDPMVNAAVNEPTFKLAGVNSDGTIDFQTDNGGDFTIANGGDVFMSAHLNSLVYSPIDNTFTGALTDLSFDPALGSPWVSEAADVFDPASADFLPGRTLYFTYTPDNDFNALTQSFSVSGTSSGTDGINAVVPEPSTLALTLAGILLGIVRRGASAKQL
jgi:hypothetical protein